MPGFLLQSKWNLLQEIKNIVERTLAKNDDDKGGFHRLLTMAGIYGCCPKIMRFFFLCKFTIKVKKRILKGSLDSIPSPSSSVKIQVINGKVYFR